MEVFMKRPTKKDFYEYMSLRFNCKYKNNHTYDTLLEIIAEASKDDGRMMELAELTLMTKTDRLIYRNKSACEGVELTPLQVDEYLATVEYGLEYIS
tara:strand:- start:109 stop:399 length:291 start_codon:yes stop_codon:yes gene_type:complete